MDGLILERTDGENKMVEEFYVDEKEEYPRILRCSDDVRIPETAKNWREMLKNPEEFQRRYEERVRRLIGRMKEKGDYFIV